VSTLGKYMPFLASIVMEIASWGQIETQVPQPVQSPLVTTEFIV